MAHIRNAFSNFLRTNTANTLKICSSRANHLRRVTNCNDHGAASFSRYLSSSTCKNAAGTTASPGTKDDLIDMKVDSVSGVATMKMQKPPVNSLNLEFLTELCIGLDKLHNEGCRALVIGSSLPKIFSAGLEITEMYQPDEARLREFWRTLQEFWIKLYGSQMFTVAAITGHAPAGGCLVSMCCDHRVMADGKFTIGLNETLLGIVAPSWFCNTMMNTVGHRETERALQLGKLYSPAEALSVGLVDEVVPLESVADSVESTMKKWLKIPDHARQLSKLLMRQPTIDNLINRRQEDIDNFVSFTMKESIQKSMGMYLEALKKRSKS